MSSLKQKAINIPSQDEESQNQENLSLVNVETNPEKWLEFRRNLRESQARTKELMRDMPPLPF